MFWFTLAGVVALVAWVVWVLCIVNPGRQVAISLLFKVEQADTWLDPFLRTVCYLFAQANHLRLLEIWIVATDEGEPSRQIVQHLEKAHPVLFFQGQAADIGTCLTQARGQALLVFDIVEQNTPLTALQALEQLLMQSGPMSSGSIALGNSPT